MRDEEREKLRVEKLREEREKNILYLLEIWKGEVLPEWESKKKSGRVKELCWKGVPSSVREKVWPLLVGNKLRISKELFKIHSQRAIEARNKKEAEHSGEDIDHEDTLNLIPVDIGRTFPHLGFFQEGGPSHEDLKNILEAYVCYRPDIGYVQGMSFVAATLLLQMDPYNVTISYLNIHFKKIFNPEKLEKKAFVCMANMFNEAIFLSFFSFNMVNTRKYCLIFEELIQLYLPNLAKHFREQQIKSDMYLIDW